MLLHKLYPRLRLTGFLGEEGEPGLVLQIQWKDLRFLPMESPATFMEPSRQEVSLYSSLQRIPYHPVHGSPPSELDISSCFSAAEFSTPCSLYLAPKIASFASDVASSLGGTSPPSLFILAELKTINVYTKLDDPPPFSVEPLIPRHQDPFRQPLGNSLGSRSFLIGYLLTDSTKVRGPLEDNRWGLAGVSKRALAKLEEEAEDCSVCLSQMSATEELLTTHCDHTFHQQCILSWLENKNTCPLCRSQLED